MKIARTFLAMKLNSFNKFLEMSVEKKLMLIVAIVISERKKSLECLPENCRSAQYMNVKLLPYLKPFFFGMHERRGYDPSSILTYC